MAVFYYSVLRAEKLETTLYTSLLLLSVVLNTKYRRGGKKRTELAAEALSDHM